MSAQRLYDALKRITAYSSPEKLRRTSQKTYGLEPDEAIEAAYENVLEEARAAIKGLRRPKDKSKPAAPSPAAHGNGEAGQ